MTRRASHERRDRPSAPVRANLRVNPRNLIQFAIEVIASTRHTTAANYRKFSGAEPGGVHPPHPPARPGTGHRRATAVTALSEHANAGSGTFTQRMTTCHRMVEKKATRRACVPCACRSVSRKRVPAGASSYCCMVGMTFAFPTCAIGSSWRAVSRAITAQPTQPRTVRASVHCACGPVGGSRSLMPYAIRSPPARLRPAAATCVRAGPTSARDQIGWPLHPLAQPRARACERQWASRH